jgi:hypothetical protein
MSAATLAQLNNIDSALQSLNACITEIQAAQHAAAVAGNIGLVQQLSGAFWEANSVEVRLVSLRTMTDINALTGAIASLKQTTTILDQQKQQIDTWVKAVGIAATVIADITAVAAAIAAL